MIYLSLELLLCI